MEIRPLTIGYDKMVSCMNDVVLWIANQESFLFKNMRMSIAVLVIIYILLSLIYWGLKFQKIRYLTATLSGLLILQWVVFLNIGKTLRSISFGYCINTTKP